MDPMMIMALISAALPVINQLVQLGEAIAKQIEGATDPATKAALQTMQSAHASQTAAIVANLVPTQPK